MTLAEHETSDLGYFYPCVAQPYRNPNSSVSSLRPWRRSWSTSQSNERAVIRVDVILRRVQYEVRNGVDQFEEE